MSGEIVGWRLEAGSRAGIVGGGLPSSEPSPSSGPSPPSSPEPPAADGGIVMGALFAWEAGAAAAAPFAREDGREETGFASIGEMGEIDADCFAAGGAVDGAAAGGGARADVFAVFPFLRPEGTARARGAAAGASACSSGGASGGARPAAIRARKEVRRADVELGVDGSEIFGAGLVGGADVMPGKSGRMSGAPGEGADGMAKEGAEGIEAAWGGAEGAGAEGMGSFGGGDGGFSSGPSSSSGPSPPSSSVPPGSDGGADGRMRAEMAGGSGRED